MCRPKKTQYRPFNIKKNVDPYDAKIVLKELYAKGVYIIQGSQYNEETQKNVEDFIKSQAKSKEYIPIFERFYLEKKGYTVASSPNLDRLSAEASGMIIDSELFLFHNLIKS